MKILCWNLENALKRLPELPAQVSGYDGVSLQALRIRAQDAENVAALERALPGYRCFYSLPRDPHNVTYRGGRAYGVATFVRGEATGEVPAWDREGRVVVVRTQGLAIVNLYAVNGTSKPYLDETGRPDGDRHAFKRRFQAQVFELARELHREGPVVLAGDWNVSRTKLDTHPRLRTEEPHARARAELNAQLHDFIDTWRARNPEVRGYTWFNVRSRSLDAARVDYFLVSEDVVVRDAAVLPRHPWSDHAPLTLDVAPGSAR